MGVGDVQVAAARFDQQVEDLPVDEGEDVGQHEDADRQPGAGAGGVAVVIHWNGSG
ncbi:hypothetical protein D3C75_1380130 [compost metagenome]